jgi:hypothetical protein
MRGKLRSRIAATGIIAANVTACTAAPPDIPRAEAMAAIRVARFCSDRFYGIDNCAAGQGFRYSFKRAGAGFLVRVSPPDRRRDVLDITVDRPAMPISHVQRLAR